jgi:hypothetical protein
MACGGASGARAGARPGSRGSGVGAGRGEAAWNAKNRSGAAEDGRRLGLDVEVRASRRRARAEGGNGVASAGRARKEGAKAVLELGATRGGEVQQEVARSGRKRRAALTAGGRAGE